MRRIGGNATVLGLAALLVGTAIGWIGGYMSVPDVVASAQNVALAVPTLNIDLLLLETKFYPALRNFFQVVRTGDESQIVLQPASATSN